MARFFVSSGAVSGGKVTVTGADAHHIARSLRMAVGQHITVCVEGDREYDCELLEIRDDHSVCAVCAEKEISSEPPYTVKLFQALPKGDKLDTVIQKAVECGVSEIIPFESRNCIVRMKPEQEGKKTERRRRIAEEAAKQCGRGALPTVRDTVAFDRMLAEAAGSDLAIFCYEKASGGTVRDVLADFAEKGIAHPTISVIIGSEGGFTPEEAERAASAGLIPTGLGNRILRTETAPIFVLSCISYAFEL